MERHARDVNVPIFHPQHGIDLLKRWTRTFLPAPFLGSTVSILTIPPCPNNIGLNFFLALSGLHIHDLDIVDPTASSPPWTSPHRFVIS